MKRKRVAGPAKQLAVRERRSSSSWAALPFPALLEIFWHLSDEDRVSSALTCSHWKSVFDSSVLWRRRTFEFGGHKSKPCGQNAIQFAAAFGRHLRDVTISCTHVTSNTCVVITNSMVPFLDALAEAHLAEFRMNGLEQDLFWKYGYLRKTVSDHLVTFIQTQQCLKAFEMTKSQLSLLPGVELLVSLGQVSGSSIEKLLLEDFFHGRLGVFQFDRYRSAMEQFTSLTEVALNYCCLSEELLTLWSNTLVGKLKRLSVKATDNEPFEHVITKGAWSRLVTSCPGLRVTFAIVGIGRSSDVVPILASSMPLVQLRFWSGYDNETELQLSNTLQHVSSHFRLRLEHLDLEFDNYHDNVDAALVQTISRCRRLSSIRVKANTRVEVAATICDMLTERRTSLTSVNITLCDISDQDIEELQVLRDRMEPTVRENGIVLSLRDNLF